MKTRVERFKNHRNEILYSDDGDLPIAKAKGKHLKKDPLSSNPQLSLGGKRRCGGYTSSNPPTAGPSPLGEAFTTKSEKNTPYGTTTSIRG